MVVFELVGDSACAECGEELGRGRWLRLENGRPLCMPCADVDHLVFLPRGDAALTRRASKYSSLRAVLVRFSRTRNRYERQGVLVDENALQRAEAECLADAEARARARERRSFREAKLDANYRSEFAGQVQRLYPSCPADEATDLSERACLKHSGRVGRTAAAKAFDPEAIELAVQAHVRHRHTAYDQLLGSGLERGEARAAVRDAVEAVLERWRRPVA
jgi:hypothetical protein